MFFWRRKKQSVLEEYLRDYNISDDDEILLLDVRLDPGIHMKFIVANNRIIDSSGVIFENIDGAEFWRDKRSGEVWHELVSKYGLDVEYEQALRVPDDESQPIETENYIVDTTRGIIIVKS